MSRASLPQMTQMNTDFLPPMARMSFLPQMTQMNTDFLPRMIRMNTDYWYNYLYTICIIRVIGGTDGWFNVQIACVGAR